MADATVARSGRDLAAERYRRGLRARELAARLGVGTKRVYEVEQQWRPTPSMTRRYLDALMADVVVPGSLERTDPGTEELELEPAGGRK